jgi:extracellular factor (EF) 3-hydroxypalmitic acid methyl ester biosynthesis protein
MTTTATTTGLLDAVYAGLADSGGRSDAIAAAMDTVVGGLRALYDEMAPAEWRAFTAGAREHRLIHLLHQDPFTCRSFYKPRGYAGDAKLIDYIYGFADEDEHVTALGRGIMQYSTNSQASHAVRKRRDILAEYIASARCKRPDARVLSVACGHLREAHLTVNDHPVADFVAVDQDPRSLSTTQQLFSDKGVRALQWRVRDLIAGRRRSELGAFDLIYAAGLYDYLADDVARKLTQSMFEMLEPGGTLLVANFVPELRDIGYMETFMDWHLTYRRADEMPVCASTIDPAAIASQRVFTEENDAIAFIELTRA